MRKKAGVLPPELQAMYDDMAGIKPTPTSAGGLVQKFRDTTIAASKPTTMNNATSKPRPKAKPKSKPKPSTLSKAASVKSTLG